MGRLTELLDHGYVRFIEPWGLGEAGIAEAGIIEAARQSTQGSFRGWEKDEKLLRFLYEHKHSSPFEFAGMVIEVQAPIMVFREWHRHRTQSYNEMSGRYTALPDLYYIPSIDRIRTGRQSSINKQGSLDYEGYTTEEAQLFQNQMSIVSGVARKVYEDLLGAGLAKELARLILPVNQYSRMRACANLRNWLAFLTLRMAPEAQFEIRQYANALAEIVKENFPRTYALFEEAA